MRRFTPVLAAALALTASPVLAQGVTATLTQLGVDTSRAELRLDDILSGGPPPQGIPALGFGGDADAAIPATQAPVFVSAEEAASWLEPEEPVVVVRLNGTAKAYPLQILTWHEIVNDTVGGVPVAVTFCPLCNSALAFDRRIPLSADESRLVRQRRPDVVLETPTVAFTAAHAAAAGTPTTVEAVSTVTFGVSGLLTDSNLLMFDTLTATLWPQLLGVGAMGTLTGVELLRYPAPIVSFADFRDAYPGGELLSRDTGFRRNYGRNPYVGYDRADEPPFLYGGPLDGRLPPKARVVVVDGDRPIAYPFELLADQRVVNDVRDGEPILVMWSAGTRSALDAATVAGGADIGSATVHSRNVGGRTLDFVAENGVVRDVQTRSTWNHFGEAIAGELSGASLTPVLHTDTFWFAYAAFRPQTEIWSADP